MTPDQAVSEAEAGKLRPVYLVLGEERLFVDRVITAVRAATQKDGIAGFNEDKFDAGDSDARAIVGAARMLPMMAPRRLVFVRALERWEKRAQDDGDDGDAAPTADTGRDAKPLDVLAEYAKAPVPSTVMILVATKLHGSRRLVTDAKKRDYVVTCEPLQRRDLPPWITKAAGVKGHAIGREVAELLAELSGPDLGCVADALERLSLYVGPGKPITEDAVAKVVTRVRESTVWELIDALSARRLDRALAALGDVFDPRDGGLRMLGAVGWSVRQLVKFDSAVRGGADVGEAAKRAGAPYKARELSQVQRALPPGTVERWLELLAETDLALKGSKRPAQAVLETMIIAMCR